MVQEHLRGSEAIRRQRKGRDTKQQPPWLRAKAEVPYGAFYPTTTGLALGRLIVLKSVKQIRKFSKTRPLEKSEKITPL